MTTLVTGGCGFVGINVAEELLREKQDVVLYDRLGLPAAAENALRGHAGRLSAIRGDVKDVAALNEVLREFEIRDVIHAAAITPGTNREAREPREIVDVNVGSTIGLLEACRNAGCRRFLYVSSGVAYGRAHDDGGVLREDLSPPRPDDINGITKFAGEQIALRLGALWNLQTVCVRVGTVCGPWEFATGVRDQLSAQLQVAKLAVRGELALVPAGESWRDWIYSRDVAAGLVAVLKAGTPRHSMYQLSAGCRWHGSLTDWCETLRKAFPGFSWRIATGGEQPNVDFPGGRDRAPMDIGRMVEDIGFTPRFGSREAYDDYIAWIQSHLDFMEA
jgi:UDP-glucuronate 4-epimerase